MISHSKSTDQKFKCEICDREFTLEFNLKRHILHSHRKKTDMKKCPICDYVTDRSDNLERHCSRKHEGLFVKVELKCENCPKVFLSQSLLRNHKSMLFL